MSSTFFTVPAGMVRELRTGLHSVLGQAAQDVSIVTDRKGRERHPEWYRDPLRRFDRARALLDLIGWAETGPPEDVLIDLSTYCWALLEALDVALLVGCDDIMEARKTSRRKPKRRKAKPTDDSERERTVVRVLVLRRFILTVEQQVRKLGLREGEPS
jgi:hypothetical protein